MPCIAKVYLVGYNSVTENMSISSFVLPLVSPNLRYHASSKKTYSSSRSLILVPIEAHMQLPISCQ